MDKEPITSVYKLFAAFCVATIGLYAGLKIVDKLCNYSITIKADDNNAES